MARKAKTKTKMKDKAQALPQIAKKIRDMFTQNATATATTDSTVASTQAKSLEQSEPVHREYKKIKAASKDKARILRRIWMCTYLSKDMKISFAAAEKIFDTERTKRSKANHKALQRSQFRFLYHISREKKPPVKSVFAKIVKEVDQIIIKAMRKFKAMDGKGGEAAARAYKADMAEASRKALAKHVK